MRMRWHLFFVVVLLAGCTGSAPLVMQNLEGYADAIHDAERSVRVDPSNIDHRMQLLRAYYAYDTEFAKLRNVPEYNQPFLIQGGVERCALLIHGFSASPHEVLDLALTMHRELNLTVYAPLLAGHGGDDRDLRYARWEDWNASVQPAFSVLKKSCDEVVVGGVSLGADLALDIAKQNEVDAIIAVSPPVVLRSRLSDYAFVLKYVRPIQRNDKLTEEQKRYYTYNRSVAAIAELDEYLNYFPQDLDAVSAPLFIIQSKNDTTIDPLSASMVLNRVQSPDKDVLWMEGESHVILNGPARQQAIEAIIQFLREH